MLQKSGNLPADRTDVPVIAAFLIAVGLAVLHEDHARGVDGAAVAAQIRFHGKPSYALNYLLYRMFWRNASDETHFFGKSEIRHFVSKIYCGILTAMID